MANKSTPKTESEPESLTAHLLSLPLVDPPCNAATHHPFIIAAGADELPQERFAFWLAQDYIYSAHAYPSFIGSVISRIPFSHGHNHVSKEEEASQKILKVLAYCLERVVRKNCFFKETLEKWGVGIGGWGERKATRDLTAEMVRIPMEGLSCALVFLWAMEKIRLDAWSYVQSQSDANPLSDESENTIIGVFAASWSSPDYVEFVHKLGRFVDGMGIRPDSPSWAKAEVIWARAIELSVNFWPEDGEDLLMKKVQ